MVLAFVLVVIKAGKDKEVLKKLRSYREVEEAHHIYGQYDIIIKTKTEDLQSLDRFINKLRKLKNIKATSTMITME